MRETVIKCDWCGKGAKEIGFRLGDRFIVLRLTNSSGPVDLCLVCLKERLDNAVC